MAKICSIYAVGSRQTRAVDGVEGGGFVQRRDEEKERGVGWREELRVLEGLWGVVVEAQESFWTDVW